ncbi:MAG: sirohydrochlorin chelatase [Fluviibacter sp.]|jgi:sirohydrochlorin cobaltochelatase
MNKALILFAHGARDPEWARPVQAVAQRLQAENPDLPVTIAFLEFMSPALPDAIDLIARQTTGAVPLQIDILPFFIAQGGHLRQEVPAMLAEIRQQHPQLQIRLLPPLGELPSVQDAIAQAITQLL